MECSTRVIIPHHPTTVIAANLCDEGALEEAADENQRDAQHGEQLQVAGSVLPPVEVAAGKGFVDQGRARLSGPSMGSCNHPITHLRQYHRCSCGHTDTVHELRFSVVLFRMFVPYHSKGGDAPVEEATRGVRQLLAQYAHLLVWC